MAKNEVINVAITEDNAKELENKVRDAIFEIGHIARTKQVDIALLVTELVEKKVHVLRGGEDNMKSAETYLKDTFGIKSTQRKVYSIVAHNYATRQADGSYIIQQSELRNYGVGNLEQITRIEGFESEPNKLKFIESKGITELTTVEELKKIRGIETKKDETKDDNNKSTETIAEDNVTTQIKAENDKLHASVTTISVDIKALLDVAKGNAMTDSEFRKLAIKELSKMLKNAENNKLSNK